MSDVLEQAKDLLARRKPSPYMSFADAAYPLLVGLVREVERLREESS